MNWAIVHPPSTHSETLLAECETCTIVEAVHTVTFYNSGVVYDPDDGLPLSMNGERGYA